MASRRVADKRDGSAFAVLAGAYLLWTAVMAVAQAGAGCTADVLCRLSDSGQLSTLVTVAPLALILGSLATRRRDESARLFAIATIAGVLLVLPMVAGEIATGLVGILL